IGKMSDPICLFHNHTLITNITRGRQLHCYFLCFIMGRMGMVFRLNVVVTSLCIVIGPALSATYASEDKSRLLPLFRYGH
ncbi:hypothetical protein, partial [Sansalvadorimonas verongulae]|uniref:hypothetical protein n=1 Tax=Sansalvadorimonas verongulae TaxID=2172824 RepID=UPI001E4C0125